MCLAHPSRGLGGDEPPALAQAMSPLDLRREPGGNASPNETASAVPGAQALRPLDSTAHLWYKRGGYCRTGGGLPNARGRFPRLFSLWELCLRELSIFIDESGSDGLDGSYYLLALVLHEQGRLPREGNSAIRTVPTRQGVAKRSAVHDPTALP